MECKRGLHQMVVLLWSTLEGSVVRRNECWREVCYVTSVTRNQLFRLSLQKSIIGSEKKVESREAHDLWLVAPLRNAYCSKQNKAVNKTRAPSVVAGHGGEARGRKWRQRLGPGHASGLSFACPSCRTYYAVKKYVYFPWLKNKVVEFPCMCAFLRTGSYAVSLPAWLFP